jgi:hypothetical protein
MNGLPDITTTSPIYFLNASSDESIIGSQWNYFASNGTYDGVSDVETVTVPNCLNCGTNLTFGPRPGPRAQYVYLRYLTLIFYLATFVVGAVGNALVIFAIGCHPETRKKSVANYYILNLAIADEIFVCTLPLFCHATYTEQWVFGNPSCKIMFVLRESNKFASVFTLVFLSFDRYLASYHGMGHLRTLAVGRWACVLTWVASFLMVMPYWLYARSEVKRNGVASCRIHWPRDGHLLRQSVWTYSQITLGLIIPFIVICGAYLFLIQRLKNIMKQRNADRVRKPNRRMTVTIAIVFATFLVCNVPYYIVEVVNLKKVEHIDYQRQRGQLYRPGKTELAVFFHFNAFAQIMVFISSCINPVLYGLFNENFSKYNVT